MPTPLQKRKLMGEINVVPYIDVMLVLLVIFMVTAPLLTQGIEVELPKANAEPIESVPDHEPLVLSVDAEGNLYINAGDDEDKPSSGKKIVDDRVGHPRRKARDAGVRESGPCGSLRQRGRRDGGAAAGRRKNIGFVTDPLDTYPIPE